MENDTKTKNKFWKGVLVGSLVTAFAGLMIVGVATGISLIARSVIDNQVTAGVLEAEDQNKVNLKRVEQKVRLLEGLVDQGFLFEENVDVEQMESGIYKGLLSALDDPYTVYYTPEEYEALTEETEGVYCGIGALVSRNLETGLTTVLRVFKDSPAEKAGMLKGDILYKVGDIEASTIELDLLVSQEIRGEEGTYVDIVVVRGSGEVNLHIRRGTVEVTTVEYEMLNEKTGYILVTQFEQVTAQQFQDAVTDLTKQGMGQLVIDLRDNPGGILDAAVEMAAYVLPEDQWDGTLVSTADKYKTGVRYFCEGGEIRFEANDGRGNDLNYPKKDGHALDIPIAVLVNEYSASASEVFAGALRDYGSAKLVGTTTFGKGIVQSVIGLGDGSAVKMTVSHYYTPSGYDLHTKGLEPDVEVKLEIPEDADLTLGLALELDNQVQKAIEVLEEE